jgi:hypothetical protein
MSVKQPEQRCETYRDELLRLACGDAAEPSAGFRAHLRQCAVCREGLPASQEFVGSLCGALAPEPMSPGLVSRIRAELCVSATTVSGVFWPWPLRIATAAVAAGLLAALLIPHLWGSSARRNTTTSDGGIALSDADRAAIESGWWSWATTWWDSPVDQSAEYLWTRVEEIDHTVAGDSQAGRWLPWSADDDWDVPKQGQGPSGARESSPACAFRDAGVAGDGRS